LSPSAADVIEIAFRHTKGQLLRPFRFAQWMRLAFVGVLAGEMSSFSGCNFIVPSNYHPAGRSTSWPHLGLISRTHTQR